MNGVIYEKMFFYTFCGYLNLHLPGKAGFTLRHNRLGRAEAQ